MKPAAEELRSRHLGGTELSADLPLFCSWTEYRTLRGRDSEQRSSSAGSFMLVFRCTRKNVWIAKGKTGVENVGITHVLTAPAPRTSRTNNQQSTIINLSRPEID